MRGQISQGLALPLKVLNIPEDKQIEGENVTTLVNLTKYNKPDPFSSARGFVPKFDGLKPWPGFLRKTDEANLRSYPKMLTEFQQQSECVVTKKLDGTSITIFIFKGQFGVCSRNFELDLSCSSIPHYTQICKVLAETDIENKLRTLRLDIALQGELCGPKINGMKKNKHLKNNVWTVFNVWNITSSEYLDYSSLVNTVEKLNTLGNGIPIYTVPVVYRGSLKDFTLLSLIDMANETEYNTGVLCEGIVIRPMRETKSEKTKGRLSAKIISEKYCLLHKE